MRLYQQRGWQMRLCQQKGFVSRDAARWGFISREALSAEAVRWGFISRGFVSREAVRWGFISREALSAERLSDEALSAERLSDEALPAEALSAEMLPDEALSAEGLSDEALSAERLSNEALSAESLCQQRGCQMRLYQQRGFVSWGCQRTMPQQCLLPCTRSSIGHDPAYQPDCGVSCMWIYPVRTWLRHVVGVLSGTWTISLTSPIHSRLTERLPCLPTPVLPTSRQVPPYHESPLCYIQGFCKLSYPSPTPRETLGWGGGKLGGAGVTTYAISDQIRDWVSDQIRDWGAELAGCAGGGGPYHPALVMDDIMAKFRVGSRLPSIMRSRPWLSRE